MCESHLQGCCEQHKLLICERRTVGLEETFGRHTAVGTQLSGQENGGEARGRGQSTLDRSSGGGGVGSTFAPLLGALGPSAR